ncbi:single-stranded DNA-binding protein [Thermocrinis minervae]|uniref:Single-stranded DNA-binding protein n=1 Tax=Thermocrinis minervae TaxID=381751 RepID=A0A1M6S8K8_9AQUI|nr:single-stranded DNA-binding protein [Thermocrinis minervae]SHK41006.1 single-strand binding protein [Thermocrinis minervae]
MLNKVLIIGRLTGDPTFQYLPSGAKVAEFTLAYNRRYKVGEEWKEESHFFDVRAYGRLAEDLPTKLSKGYLVVVEGRLTQHRWIDKEGNKRSKVRIIAESVRIISKPKVEDTIEEEVLPVERFEDLDSEEHKIENDEDIVF